MKNVLSSRQLFTIIPSKLQGKRLMAQLEQFSLFWFIWQTKEIWYFGSSRLKKVSLTSEFDLMEKIDIDLTVLHWIPH